jgi:hypothetical protein
MKLAVLTTDAFTDPEVAPCKPTRIDPAILRSVMSECLMKLDHWVQTTYAEAHQSIAQADLNTDQPTRPELARYILHSSIIDGLRELCAPILQASSPDEGDVYEAAVNLNQYLTELDVIALSNDEMRGRDWEETAIIVPIEGYANKMSMFERDHARLPCVVFMHGLAGHFAFAAGGMAFDSAKFGSERQAFLDALHEFGDALTTITTAMRQGLQTNDDKSGDAPQTGQVLAFRPRKA